MHIALHPKPTINDLKNVSYKTLIYFNCLHCNLEFTRMAKEVTSALRRRRNNFLCSRQCVNKWQIKSQKVCPECRCLFKGKKFCSPKCCTIYNKKTKERHKKICTQCNINLINKKNNICINCQSNNKFLESQKRTLQDIKNNSKNFHSIVRSQARKAMIKYGVERRCMNCHYDKFVECCHIKSISSFELSSTLEIVNNLNNLKWLCPNCHWEHDNLN